MNKKAVYKFNTKEERMGYIEDIDCIAADLEDGAYIMEENGITLDELVQFAEYREGK